MRKVRTVFCPDFLALKWVRLQFVFRQIAVKICDDVGEESEHAVGVAGFVKRFQFAVKPFRLLVEHRDRQIAVAHQHTVHHERRRAFVGVVKELRARHKEECRDSAFLGIGDGGVEPAEPGLGEGVQGGSFRRQVFHAFDGHAAGSERAPDEGVFAGGQIVNRAGRGLIQRKGVGAHLVGEKFRGVAVVFDLQQVKNTDAAYGLPCQDGSGLRQRRGVVLQRPHAVPGDFGKILFEDHGTLEGTAEIGDRQRRFPRCPIHAAEMSFHLIDGNEGGHCVLSFGLR